MPRLNMLLVAAFFGTSTMAAAVNMTELYDESGLFRRDPVPNKIRQCATYADLKWQPALDFDKDGCYNTPAIDANGFLNPGMECNNSPQGGCRDEVDLDNNQVYSRSRCNNGWCAHLYAYYFEKDFDKCGLTGGHKHDWEHVVVWTKNDQGQFVGASAHGDYDIKYWNEVRKDGGTHPKIVYHLGGAMGTRTHSFRFANAGDDAVENHKGRWFYGTLLSYFGWPSVALRNQMMRANWGKASIDIRDQNVQRALEKSQNVILGYIDAGFGGDRSIANFKAGQDAPDGHNSPGRINGCGVSS